MLESARAQTDDMIIETFGEAAITRVLAPAGSWFLEDVYGFHKGGRATGEAAPAGRHRIQSLSVAAVAESADPAEG
ncbi:MAG: hypothetical protein WDN06_16490 [Asticcacaulis sp.]